DSLAAPLRDGEGQVLSADRRLHRRARGGTHRTGDDVLAARSGHASSARRGRPARARQSDLDPVDQARPQQLAAPGGTDLRSIARARDAVVLVPGRARGCEGDSREADTGVSVREVTEVHVVTETQAAPRTGHPYHMHDAIYAQPGALRLVARG